MKILYLPFALLCELSNIRDAYAAEPEATFQDDHKYTYLDNEEVALTCGEIREFDETRQELCLIEEVKMHCPFSCGICCKDTDSYIINCEWIAEQGWRKVEYCGQTFEHRMVQEMCPIACDYCMDHVDGTETSQPTSARSPTSHPIEKTTAPAPHESTKAPSKAPSGHVDPSSSKAPTSFEAPSSKVPTPTAPVLVPKPAPAPVNQPVSIDTVDVTFQYVIPDMCAWVSASREGVERFCGQSSDANAEVFAKCPATCSQLESRSNAYPCSDLPDTYTFPALYTDALRTCSWVAKREIREYRYCKPEQQLTACAMTCGVCDLAATSRPSLSISPSSSSAPPRPPSRPPSPQPSPFPTLRPTAAPSISINPSSSIKPSSAPTRGDTPGYLFNRTPDEEATMVPCKWLCRNSVSPTVTYERQELWCRGDVLENCHASCHSSPECTSPDKFIAFDGIEEMFSIGKGQIELRWSVPFLSEELLSEGLSPDNVQYHVFHGIQNFTGLVQEKKFSEVVEYFNKTSSSSMSYDLTTDAQMTIFSNNFGKLYWVYVVAQVDDFVSNATSVLEIKISSTSPTLYNNVTIVGYILIITSLLRNLEAVSGSRDLCL